MILEKEDWEEAGCCFRPSPAVFECCPGNGTDRIRKTIEKFDRLIAMDAAKEAGEHLEQSLEEFERAGDWPSQVTILNEMMGFYRNQGNREQGLWSVKQGLRLVKERGLGGTVSGGTTYLNAATTMKAFGQAKEAFPYYEEAMRSYGNSLDPGDYRFGGLFHNMALAYEDAGEFFKAEAYYRKAMEIMERLKPESILEIAVTWVSLAVLYEKWGREEKIAPCLERAIEGFHSEEVLRDGYYAFNCRKCADTFGHFGYFRIKKELSETADLIYRLAREQEAVRTQEETA